MPITSKEADKLMIEVMEYYLECWRPVLSPGQILFLEGGIDLATSVYSTVHLYD